MRSVEMFTGCGGLALGLSHAGFHHLAMVEWNKAACETLTHNANLGNVPFNTWPFEHADVRNIDWSEFTDISELIAGGPPCQPFSVGGRHKGHEDDRNMWPEAIRAVREIKPQAFLFENVRGLTRPAFSDYLEYITLSLANPDTQQSASTTLQDHFQRLQQSKSPDYFVTVRCVNAANYGAPQKRHRVIIMGYRTDLGMVPDIPRPTHSRERLLWEQWVTGEYWDTRGLRRPSENPSNRTDVRTVEKLRSQMVEPSGKAWITCRDAFSGLGEPDTNQDVPNHRFQSGAKVYPGHTGSPIDAPAKALKAGDHGVPGGENMMVLLNGSVRYFSIREAARLQGLPDEYEFPCSWTESMRQLGNAVPVPLATAIGSVVYADLMRLNQERRAA